MPVRLDHDLIKEVLNFVAVQTRTHAHTHTHTCTQAHIEIHMCGPPKSPWFADCCIFELSR